MVYCHSITLNSNSERTCAIWFSFNRYPEVGTYTVDFNCWDCLLKVLWLFIKSFVLLTLQLNFAIVLSVPAVSRYPSIILDKQDVVLVTPLCTEIRCFIIINESCCFLFAIHRESCPCHWGTGTISKFTYWFYQNKTNNDKTFSYLQASKKLKVLCHPISHHRTWSHSKQNLATWNHLQAGILQMKCNSNGFSERLPS